MSVSVSWNTDIKLTTSIGTDVNTLCIFCGDGDTDPCDYILPLIGKEGNYHSREIWLYRDHLRDNIAQRAVRYINR